MKVTCRHHDGEDEDEQVAVKNAAARLTDSSMGT